MNFNKFKLDININKAIELMEYKDPTPIQDQAIPFILEGHDLMGLAQTGTGKTAAFLLPILNNLITNQKKGVKALVIAPTRELAHQIHQAINSFSKFIKIKSLAMYGGTNFDRQTKMLKLGVDIVVACPGRLLDHIKRKTINLNNLDFLVLDEVDQMFDIGFLPDIRRIVKSLPEKRQTVIFSATMPEEIKKLTHEVLTNPKVIQTNTIKPAVTIKQYAYPVKHDLKTALLLEILKNTGSSGIIIFAKTKSRVKRLARELQDQKYKVTDLQGDLSAGRRKAALEGLKKGLYDIMVATDVAARGIDVSTISHVINFDMPDTTDAYIHRIGRTGRANKTGDAYTFYTKNESSMIFKLEKIIESKMEVVILPGFDYNKTIQRNKDSRPSFNRDRTNNKSSSNFKPRSSEGFSKNSSSNWSGNFKKKSNSNFSKNKSFSSSSDSKNKSFSRDRKNNFRPKTGRTSFNRNK